MDGRTKKIFTQPYCSRYGTVPYSYYESRAAVEMFKLEGTTLKGGGSGGGSSSSSRAGNEYSTRTGTASARQVTLVRYEYRFPVQPATNTSTYCYIR